MSNLTKPPVVSLIDEKDAIAENTSMETIEKTADLDADLHAIVERIGGKPLDPGTYQRIREQGKRITDELRRKHGEMTIAVDLVREARDEA
jgi:hypothetical protein